MIAIRFFLGNSSCRTLQAQTANSTGDKRAFVFQYEGKLVTARIVSMTFKRFKDNSKRIRGSKKRNSDVRTGYVEFVTGKRFPARYTALLRENRRVFEPIFSGMYRVSRFIPRLSQAGGLEPFRFRRGYVSVLNFCVQIKVSVSNFVNFPVPKSVLSGAAGH